jgi:starch synthase
MAIMNDAIEPTVALLPWGDVWEDFFATVNVSLDAFANELTGGWQFGFIEALKAYGVRTVLFYPSTLVKETYRFIHKPTGTPVCLLPVPTIYSRIRRRMIHPYPSLAYWGTLEDLFGESHGLRRYFNRGLRHIAPYLATPLRLLAREIKNEHCSAIFCQEYEYCRFDLSILLGKLLKMPVFATFQGGTYDCNRIGRFLHRYTIKRCDGLVIGPKAEIERVRKRYALQPFQLARIFNPVDLSMWKEADREKSRAMFNLPEDAEVIMWHGRVDIHNKGLDLLLKGWKQVSEKYPQ